MSIPAVGPVAFTPFVPGTLPVDSATAAGATQGSTGADFGQLLANGLQQLQGLHAQSDQLAVAAATGDLNAIHDYTIAATEANVTTQLTVAVRNKAVEAFTEIMRMQM